MKVGFYDFSHLNSIVSMLKSSAGRNRYIEISRHDCLCEYEEPQTPEDIAIVHSHGTPDCLKKTKQMIEGNLQTEFYVIAIGRLKQEKKGLGEHPNLTYLDSGKVLIRKFCEFKP